ncbi:MAG TPA: hypothetical protein VFS36_11755 [Chitinophagaceae bacterium]|nr:hypothetical protein [Chitinophagaceae bacterium]
MVPALRKSFNEHFTTAHYENFLKDLHNVHPGSIEFRVAETPIFIPKDFTQKMLDACEHIIDVITGPSFKELTQSAIPKNLSVPNENAHPHFIAFDFGICADNTGAYEPQLIEMQGFPSLFAFQVLLPEISRKHFPVPENYSCYLNQYDRKSYLELLKKIILGDEQPEQVILLEIFPQQQKTRIDFYCTEDYLGIKPVCLTELIKDGNQLFYMNNGKKPSSAEFTTALFLTTCNNKVQRYNKKVLFYLKTLILNGSHTQTGFTASANTPCRLSGIPTYPKRIFYRRLNKCLPIWKIMC